MKLLERLAAILDSLPGADLRGCKVLLGDVPTGIDRLGHLCLNQDEGPADWQELLTQVCARQHLVAVNALPHITICLSLLARR